MVATWLTELLLDQLNRALLQPDAAGEAGGSDGAADGSYQQVHSAGRCCIACAPSSCSPL